MKRTHLSRLFSTAAMLAGAVPAATVQAAEPNGYEGPKEKLHVYVLLGGSTMAGRAEPDTEDGEVIDRCYLLNDDGKWEPAKGPLNRYSTIRNQDRVQKRGPGHAFAETMLDADKSISIGLVVNAGGGKENFIEHWRYKDSVYREARRRTKIACATGTLKGVLYHEDGSRIDSPLSYLKDLIGNLRVDFRLLNLPFIVGEVASEGDGNARNELYKALVSDTHATGVAPATGLTTASGNQFDTASVDRLGTRYAEQMLGVQAAWRARQPRPLAPNIKIIDAHVHASANKENGLDSVAEWMKRNNVDRCISKPLTPTRAKNAAEREIMLANFRKYRGKIYRFALIEPDEVSTVEEAVEILKKEKAEGAIGFGEHYGRNLMFDDPKNLRLYAACEQVGLPIHFHIDDNKNMDERGLPRVERVLQMFPKCNFIAHAQWWLHLSEGTCDYLLKTYPNMYAEPSGLRMASVLNRDRTYTREFLIRNADKVLFGTDAGWWSFGESKENREIQFDLFEQLDLPDDVRTKIYMSNAERLFGLANTDGESTTQAEE